MGTRDLFAAFFSPPDLLLAAAIALAGFAVGVLDYAAGAILRWIDKASGVG